MSKSVPKTSQILFKTALSILLLNAVSVCRTKETIKVPSEPAVPATPPAVEPTASAVPDSSIVPYTTEERSINLPEKHIYGKAYIPNNGIDRHPTVILCHGIGNTLNDPANFSMMFAERGIAAYAFDFCNGTENAQSSGDPLQMTVHTEAEDLNDVIDFVKEQEFTDPDHLYLLGQSQGGYIVTETAPARQQELAGIILMYPAYNIPDLIQEHYPDRTAVPDTVTMYDVTVGRDYLLDAMEEDIEQDMRSYEGSVLLLHGSEDTLVPIAYSEHAAELFPHAELIRIEGAEHGFFGPFALTALDACLQFISSTYH